MRAKWEIYEKIDYLLIILIELTDRDRQAFAEALLNPAPPSDRSAADAQWYQQILNK